MKQYCIETIFVLVNLYFAALHNPRVISCDYFIGYARRIWPLNDFEPLI